MNTTRTTPATGNLSMLAPSGNTRRRPASVLGLEKTSSTVPVSTMRPCSRMATWVQMDSTTAISWVMMMAVMPRRLLMS